MATASSSRLLDGASSLLAPADAARRWLYASVARLVGTHALGRWARDRELRVGAVGASTVAVSFVLTLLAPTWMLALGPVVLGVPHIAADIRYLIARPGLHRRLEFWIGVALPVAVAGVTGRSSWACVAMAGAAMLAEGSLVRRAIGAVLGGALAFGALRAGLLADLIFAHAHNVVGVLFFWAYRKRTGRAHLLPIALFAAGSLLLATGALDAIAFRSLVGPASEPISAHVDALAPAWAIRSWEWGLRLVLVFAFAQSVHYAVWLRLVPEEARPRSAPRSFAMSLRALAADIGLAGAALTAVLAVFFLGYATVDLVASRHLYLRVAAFHGGLELAVAVWFWVEARRPVP